MKYLGILLMTMILCGSSFSQYRKSITVKAGEDIAQSFSPNGFYRFAQFSNAGLYNKKRSGPSDMLFNYNILTDHMQFINNTKDTMDMMNPTLFDSVIIENTVFYYRQEEGFLELIATAWPVRLVKKTSIKMKTETVGAYGTSNATSSVDRMKTLMVGNNVYNYKSNENMVIKTMVDWYWIGDNGNLLKATKKNLLPLLSPEKASAADNFIKQNKISFDKESDLVKLLVGLR